MLDAGQADSMRCEGKADHQCREQVFEVLYMLVSIAISRDMTRVEHLLGCMDDHQSSCAVGARKSDASCCSSQRARSKEGDGWRWYPCKASKADPTPQGNAGVGLWIRSSGI